MPETTKPPQIEDDAKRRADHLREIWPTGEDPLRLRFQAAAYQEGDYKPLRSSFWGYTIVHPTPGFAEDILKAYDLLHMIIERYGPQCAMDGLGAAVDTMRIVPEERLPDRVRKQLQ